MTSEFHLIRKMQFGGKWFRTVKPHRKHLGSIEWNRKLFKLLEKWLYKIDLENSCYNMRQLKRIHGSEVSKILKVLYGSTKLLGQDYQLKSHESWDSKKLRGKRHRIWVINKKYGKNRRKNW